MFYLPLSLFNFIALLNYFYSLLHNFIIFPPQCSYSLLHNFYHFPSSMFLFPPPQFLLFSLLNAFYSSPPQILLFSLLKVFYSSPPPPPPPHFDCFDRVDVGSMWGRCGVDVTSLLFSLLHLLIFIVFPPPPPHFDCFPSSSSFLLFSLKKGQRGQTQAYKDKLECDGLILASLAFSRENNRKKEEEGKQSK